jgi:hypothetical protein
MSKEEASISSNPLITKWVGELGDTFCFTNPEDAFCKTCGITVSVKKKVAIIIIIILTIILTHKN